MIYNTMWLLNKTCSWVNWIELIQYQKFSHEPESDMHNYMYKEVAILVLYKKYIFMSVVS